MADSARIGSMTKPGRRPSTSHEHIEETGLRLFAERGFDAVSVDDIAAAVGIGRRTLFRYYPSKNDIIWGQFDQHLQSWDAWLRSETGDADLLEAIRAAVVHFNDFGAHSMPSHRIRMSLILNNPALQAHATLRYENWRSVIAGLAADRLGCAASDFAPVVIGHVALGAALASYETWLDDPDSDLLDLLDRALGVLDVSVDLAARPAREPATAPSR